MTNNLLICINKVGGLYNFRREVVKAIVDAGYKVFISVPDDDPRAEFFQKMGCVIVKTPFNRRGMNPLADLKLLVAYRRLIKKIKPFAVLTYTIKPNVYGGIVSRLFNIPQIANVIEEIEKELYVFRYRQMNECQLQRQRKLRRIFTSDMFLDNRNEFLQIV